MTTNKRTANCGAWCATATLEDGTVVAVPLTCRSWDCPSCARTLKRRLLRRLQNASVSCFATLTTSERTAATPLEAFQIASAAIPVLFKRWRRRYPGQAVEYFLVWERTKRGWPHAHILISGPKPSKHWLSHTWNQLTHSYITDLQAVSSAQQAAGYITKYLTKDPQVPEGQRRFRRSAHFFQTREEPPPFKLPVVGGWTRQPMSAVTMAYKWLTLGKALDYSQSGIFKARDDPAEHLRQMETLLPYRLQRQADFQPLEAFRGVLPGA